MKRNILISKIDHLIARPIMLRFLSDYLQLYIVNEFPKSGGSWLSQILSDYLQIEFPQNKIPAFKTSLIHGHYLNLNNLNRSTIIIRDGRDVMVSWYHHCYFINDKYNERLVNKMKTNFPYKNYSDVKNNLPKFIENHFQLKHPFGFSWKDFMISWKDKQDLLIRYEDLLLKPFETLHPHLRRLTNNDIDKDKLKLIIDKYSFSSQSGRTAGNGKKYSFMRKGIQGDWKNYFNDESINVFNNHGYEIMKFYGYSD